MSKNKNYDVVIVGGGLAGLSLACLMGKIEGLRVACLDREDPQRQMAHDERTTAISYGSSLVLDRAGIWKDLLPFACPIEDIEILDGGSPVLLQFLSREVDGKSFGWILPNAVIRKTLLAQIAALKNVDHIAPQNILDFAVSDEYAEVLLEGGGRLRASLVVGADGRGSFVRDWMDIPVREWNYRQRAVICVVEHEHSHYNKAVEHFWPEGPFAVLPMADDQDGRHRSSLVFTEHGPEKNSLMRLDDADFYKAVVDKFPSAYGTIAISGPRQCYPLSLVHAARYVGPRMALCADAAHGIHPIAGQGLNLGFRDLVALARLIEEARENGADIGGKDVLETYQRRRRPDNTAMIAVTDALVRLFSNNIAPVKILRRAGLKAVAGLPAAKRFFMKRAMGE